MRVKKTTPSIRTQFTLSPSRALLSRLVFGLSTLRLFAKSVRWGSKQQRRQSDPDARRGRNQMTLEGTMATVATRKTCLEQYQ